ncbi:MAG: cytochrome-c peroxidase [Bacteroidia bacterium]|nr:cytochrome-c peroxidase [Bacteroidia bacterium]
MKKLLVYGVIALPLSIAAVFTGCSVDAEIPEELTKEDVKFYVPQGFPQPVYNFAANPVSIEGFELGRKLFYDPRLSRDNTISCGSCHMQSGAFSHIEHRVSHGIDGLTGTRNAPGLWNLAWHQTFMWDGGINHIESQPLGPIANPVEMDENIANVLVKLRNDANYPRMFEAAFGSDTITTQRMMWAMTQFQGLMISANSKYDQVQRGEAQFTQAEQSGLATFRSKCSSCHTEPLFTDDSFHNNGLPPEPTVMDAGRMRITNDPADSLKFKTPSLRNIAITGPYMHDGRFVTLAQCLNHYSGTMYPSSTLDPQLTSGIPLTAQEKSDLLAFLATLTDYTFIQDPKFKEQ